MEKLLVSVRAEVVIATHNYVFVFKSINYSLKVVVKMMVYCNS